MTHTQTIRNILIVLVIAALIDLLPGGGTAAAVTLQVLSLAFLAVIAWIASRLYREHRDSIYALGPRRRAILYTAIGVATLTLTASGRMLVSSLGTVTWLLLLGGSGYAVFAVYRSHKLY